MDIEIPITIKTPATTQLTTFGPKEYPAQETTTTIVLHLTPEIREQLFNLLKG